MDTLLLDPKASPEELAKAIATLPDGTDLGSDCVGELGRVLLTGKPEERDSLKYAQVFEEVRRLEITPWMAFAARNQSINGRRRAKGADMTAIAEEIGVLKREASAALDHGPHKCLLLGEIAYNLGIVSRGLRRYPEEMSAQRESSAWYGLASNFAKADTSLFCSQVGAVSAAFVAGDSDSIRENCLALATLRDFVKSVHSPYPAWMVDNASIHIAWALMMEFLYSSISSDLIRRFESDFYAGERSRFEQWKRVFDVWRDYTRKEFDRVIATNPIDTQSSSLDNARLTVHTLVALAKRERGDTDGARALLEAVANHAGPDGGIPIAVAKKLLM